MSFKVIFFDVGGTLVFPDPGRILQPLLARGIRPTGTDLAAAERAAKSALDARITQDVKVTVDRGYWDSYYAALLRELGCSDEELKQELVSLVQTSSNWSLLAEGAEWTLRQLAGEYRLGIISNSDGGISELLLRLGIRELFDCIIDSGIVGHEKPDSRIFLAAMKGMAVPAPQAVYLGDIYSVDYLGAKAVGMQAILMDAAGVYRDKAVPRIESIRQLPQMLKRFTATYQQRT